MPGKGVKGRTSTTAKVFAVLAVLLMVFSAFAIISDRASDSSAETSEQTSLEATVVYHAGSLSVDADYNEDSSGASRSFTYYGTVVSTEYNPQVWDFEDDRWFEIKSYSKGNTYVFTGWKFATGGSVQNDVFTPNDSYTTAYDPGDVILYDSSDDHWYVGENETRTRVDIEADGKIHAYATWGLLKHYSNAPLTETNQDWSDGTKFTNIITFSGDKKLSDFIGKFKDGKGALTIRAADISNVGGSTLNDDGETGSTYTLKSDLIIDNVSMRYVSGKAGAKIDINAGSKVLVIGDGINSIKTAGAADNKKGYGQYATLFGGSNGDTKMIIHSGIYSCIFGGGKDKCKSVTIMNGGTVLDTIGGGNHSGNKGTTGDLYLYLTGLTAYSDSYTDYLLNHQNGDTKIKGTGKTEVIESSMVVGGNGGGDYTNKVTSTANSTHVFLTGTSDVWTIQAAGREQGSRITKDANMEISGRALVRNVACGCITDAKTNNEVWSNIDGNVNITVRDAPMIASLVGGGYDTWKQSVGACFIDGTININISGGTIGYVYGGGLRGPIGIEGHGVQININITGGNIVNDVYGGGSGTLVKIKHTNADGSVEPNEAYKDTTGLAYVVGDITINMSGGTVNGSIYGGGKSVATVSNYGSGEFSIFRQNVASVEGNTTVNVSGGTVNGNVFGAGRGIDTSTLNTQNAIDSEYSSLYVIRNKGSPSTVPNLKDPLTFIREDVSLSAEMQLAYIPWAYQNLSKTNTDLVKVTFSQDDVKYEEYAKVTGNTNVNVSGGAIKGAVYGGGAIGKVYGNTNIHITGGIIEGTVYGGGLGVVGRTSVFGKRKTTVGGVAYIKGSVYGGSALGTDGLTTGQGVIPYYDENYTGTYDAVIYLKAGTIDGSVFGGGFKGITNGDTHIFVGEDSLLLKENDVLVDNNSQKTIAIGGSIYLGGDVGVIRNSSEAYINNMVMGSGELYMAKDPDPEVDNIFFSGSIMGSGNSCLTKGETTVYLKDLVSFATASGEAIHRATNVTIDGCVLELNGRATIENTLSNVNNTDYSLYRIEHLNLKNGSIFVLNGAINYVYELNSLNSNGDQTTSTSPLNKIVVGGGNLFMLKEIEWGDNSSYTESYVGY